MFVPVVFALHDSQANNGVFTLQSVGSTIIGQAFTRAGTVHNRRGGKLDFEVSVR